MNALRLSLILLASLAAGAALAQRSGGGAPSLAGAQMGTHVGIQNNGAAALNRQLRHAGPALSQNVKPKADGKK